MEVLEFIDMLLEGLLSGELNSDDDLYIEILDENDFGTDHEIYDFDRAAGRRRSVYLIYDD